MICHPKYFRLSVVDTRVETADTSDKISVGDILEIYAPETRCLRFKKVAAAVSIESRSVTWEDEIVLGGGTALREAVSDAAIG